MSWVQVDVVGVITNTGSIIASVSSHRVMTTSRPASIVEAGADLEVMRMIKERRPGTFRTMGFLGGAIAFVVRRDAIGWPRGHLADRLREKYGEFGERVLMLIVRNLEAPGLWLAADLAGGTAETHDLMATLAGEAVELCASNRHGWARFVLGGDLAPHQDAFDAEQRDVMAVRFPELPRTLTAGLIPLDVGRDRLDGRRGIIYTGECGEFELAKVMLLDLPQGTWHFHDGELHRGKPLRRQIVAVAERPERTPIVFPLGPDGRFNDRAQPFALYGENLGLVAGPGTTNVLQALGWLPKEEGS